MFKKRQTRNIRKRQSDDEEGNGETRSDTESRGSNGSASLKELKKGPEPAVGSSFTKSVPSTSSLLSFGGDDEDEDVFQVRKSTASRNLDRARQRAAKSVKETSEEKSLKTGGLRSTSKTSALKNDDVFIIKQVGKFDVKIETQNTPPPPILVGGDAEDADDDDDTDPMMGKFKEVLTSGAIPDASLIHLARKQRQMAREMGTPEAPGTYVPLKKVDDTQKYKKEKSRLIREDDENENSDSGEEGGRFYSKLHDEDEEDRRKVEADFLRVEQGDSDEEKDDELERWEREQIRKGVSRNQVNYFGQEYITSNYGSGTTILSGHYAAYGEYERKTDPAIVKEIREPQPMDIDMDLADDDDVIVLKPADRDNQRTTALPKVGGGPQVPETIVTFQDIKTRLEKRQGEQQAMLNTRMLEREKVREFLTENETSTSKLELSVPLLSTQHQFYQEMRTYVRDLLDCLNEKVPLIEQLSEKMMDIWASRANFLIRRRQQDVKDQYEECSAASSGKMQLLQQDSDRMMRAAEREARRTRRRQGREKTLASLGHHEGMSSDEEEAPSRIVNFNSEKEKLAANAAEVFKDTVEEFSSMDEILGRFMEWRKLYKDSFDQAFIIYCLPKLLSPLIQWQVFNWSPLEAGSASLKSMGWYTTLEDSEKSQREMFKDDEEFELVFSVVDIAVIPRIKHMVEHIWDPTSASQSSNLVAFMSNLQRDHPVSSANGKHFKLLKEAVRNRIKQSLDDDLFTPIYSKDAVENKATGASAFLDRQFWFSLKVIQNLCAWTAIFSDKEVQEFVFDGVVNRHVILGLQCGGAIDMTTLTKCKTVCSSLPSSWFAGLKEGESLPQSEPLCKMLVRVADELNGNKAMEKPAAKEATKEIYRLLLKLRGWKHAEVLSQKYRVK